VPPVGHDPPMILMKIIGGAVPVAGVVSGSGVTADGQREVRMSRSGAEDSARRWREVRQRLNARRHELTTAAARLYPDVPRVGPTILLCRPEWIARRPIDLSHIRLTWTDTPPPAADVTGPASAGVRAGYPTYAAALVAIEPPVLLENRPCYRLLSADLTGDVPALELTRARYCDGISGGEAIAHELAQECAEPGQPLDGRLPLREFLGDPTDLSGRAP
jgi:hypothetical protein